ncbi:ribonuclease HII [Marinicella rhabdoformis]|uniref:ribonuclease HII n=1 Tax=Marinicella rhabdoformis TaxID=2580566 RepID=UPI0012AED4A4|nr:ribonuclease HII [Marinicella rhabdoformis]
MKAVKLTAGVDEAGRGPLAGPVTVSAVILPDELPDELLALDDSKKLSEKKRLALLAPIKSHALAWTVVHVSVEEIDQINIFQATMKGMTQAVNDLAVTPDFVQIDGNKIPQNLCINSEAIVGGDGKVAAISAASILAKSARDELMQELGYDHPEYGFERHKGYGTAAHMIALKKHGPCAAHRKTFAPVRDLIQGELF